MYPYYLATAYASSTLLGDSDPVSNKGGHRTEAVASSQLISSMLDHDELGFLVSLSSGASKPYMNFSSLRSLASRIDILQHSCCLMSAPRCPARIDTSTAILQAAQPRHQTFGEGKPSSFNLLQEISGEQIRGKKQDCPHMLTPGTWRTK
jgi:hypothetical protein